MPRLQKVYISDVTGIFVTFSKSLHFVFPYYFFLLSFFIFSLLFSSHSYLVNLISPPPPILSYYSINDFCSSLRSYVNCSGPGWALHSDIVMPYITHYGSKEQIEKFIPDMTAGKKIGAIAMTEPGAGRLAYIIG